MSGTDGRMFVFFARNYSLPSGLGMPFTEPPPPSPYLEFPGAASTLPGQAGSIFLSAAPVSLSVGVLILLSAL